MADTSVVLLIRKQLKRKSILSSAGSQPLFSLVWVAAGVPDEDPNHPTCLFKQTIIHKPPVFFLFANFFKHNINLNHLASVLD